jgi:hypothetical protein
MSSGGGRASVGIAETIAMNPQHVGQESTVSSRRSNDAQHLAVQRASPATSDQSSFDGRRQPASAAGEFGEPTI